MESSPDYPKVRREVVRFWESPGGRSTHQTVLTQLRAAVQSGERTNRSGRQGLKAEDRIDRWSKVPLPCGAGAETDDRSPPVVRSNRDGTHSESDNRSRYVGMELCSLAAVRVRRTSGAKADDRRLPVSVPEWVGMTFVLSPGEVGRQ